MFCMSGIVIFCFKSQMEFAVAQVIGAFFFFQPGQFQIKGAFLVGKKCNDVTAVGSFIAADFLQSEGFLIESNGFVQILYIVIFVNHFKSHINSSLIIYAYRTSVFKSIRFHKLV